VKKNHAEWLINSQ